jgi:hypothetical protein
MKMLLAAALAVTMGLAGPASAGDFTEGMDDQQIAGEAGDVIGGAQACGYTLDMTKVQAFIEGRIAEMGGDNRGYFRDSVYLRNDSLLGMPEVERLTQCILQKKMAQKYGFLAN